MYLTPQRILLAGATGLTGEHLLDRLLCEPTILEVLAPTRQALAEHPHLRNPIGPLVELLPELNGHFDTAFCCLGSTIKQAGSQEAFRAIDLDLVLAFAQRARALGVRHLLVISAIGANAQSRIFYNQVKGEMEQALLAMDWPQLTIVRPSLLLGQRLVARQGESWAAPLLRWLPGRYRAIEATTLARALWRLALEESQGVRIIESGELRQLGR